MDEKKIKILKYFNCTINSKKDKKYKNRFHKYLCLFQHCFSNTDFIEIGQNWFGEVILFLLDQWLWMISYSKSLCVRHIMKTQFDVLQITFWRKGILLALYHSNVLMKCTAIKTYCFLMLKNNYFKLFTFAQVKDMFYVCFKSNNPYSCKKNIYYWNYRKNSEAQNAYHSLFMTANQWYS